MGNGASQQTDNRLEDSDNDSEDYEELEKAAQQKAKAAKQQKQTKGNRKKDNSPGKDKNKIVPPKIIGLEDTDDDEPAETKGKKSFFGRNKSKNKDSSLKDDKKLKEDLDDLDRTFSSLGLVGKNMWNDNDYSEDNTRTFATTGRWENNIEAPEANNFLNSSYSSHTRFPRGAGHKTISHHSHNPHNRLNALNTTQKTLKFSWDDTQDKLPKDRGTEDWKYTKVRILIRILAKRICFSINIVSDCDRWF